MIVCPFCGLATDAPHETQAACIQALQAEITRVRQIVHQTREEEDDDAEEPAARPGLHVRPVVPRTRKP